MKFQATLIKCVNSKTCDEGKTLRDSSGVDRFLTGSDPLWLARARTHTRTHAQRLTEVSDINSGGLRLRAVYF